MDPRVERTRTAVVRAATDLLVQGGPAAVTVDAIVARSRVAKSTIYRHWESRDDILHSVLEHCVPRLEAPPADLAFADALRALTADVVRTLTDPAWRRVLPALLLLGIHEDGIADIEQRMGDQQDTLFADVLDRGIAEGLIRPDVDVRQAAATWLGPLVFAHLTGRLPLDESLAAHAVDVVRRVYGN